MSETAERRVTILLTKRQYDEMAVRAGIAPMGAYIKSVLFGDRSVLPKGRLNEDDAKQEIAVSAVIRKGPTGGNEVDFSDKGEQGVPSYRKAAKTCAHGTAKGYHCWQCKGIAEVT